MTDNKLAAFISACITVLAIVVAIATYSSCESQRNRRAKCIERSSAAECAVLFKESGSP